MDQCHRGSRLKTPPVPVEKNDMAPALSLLVLAAFLGLAWRDWLRRRREHTAAILEAGVGRAVLCLDRRGRLTHVAPMARRLLGLDGRVDRYELADLPLQGLDEALAKLRGGRSEQAEVLLEGRAREVATLSSVPALPMRALPAFVVLTAKGAGAEASESHRSHNAQAAVGASAEHESRSDDAASEARPSHAGSKVLLVEDSADNQLLMTYLLQREQVQVVLVDNGAAAISMVENESFDAVLLDMSLPDMTGFEVAEAIRARFPRLPIVATTASSGAEFEARAREAGCIEFLTKPIGKRVLSKLLVDIVRGHGTGVSDEQGNASVRELEAMFDDPEFVAIVEEFQASLDERRGELGAAFDDKDFERVTLLAHRLKGAASSFAFDQLASAAAALEENPESTEFYQTLDQALGESASLSLGR